MTSTQNINEISDRVDPLKYEEVQENRMIYSTTLKTKFRNMTAAAEDNALTGLWFENQKYYPSDIGETVNINALPIFSAVQSWLDSYFTGNVHPIDFKLAPKGSDFQQAIWRLLLQIPCGKVSTYGEIAKKVAKDNGRASMSAQAVGGAVGHNPISVIIPCHRVVGTNGSLTGYAGGLDIKVKLLETENANLLSVIRYDDFE